MWNKKSLFLIKIFVNASCVISVKYVWWMRQRDNPNNKSELKSFFKGLKKNNSNDATRSVFFMIFANVFITQFFFFFFLIFASTTLHTN